MRLVCNYKHTRLFLLYNANISGAPTTAIKHFLIFGLFHFKMNVDNLQRRTNTFTCDDDYHWLYWSNRSQEQDVNTTTRGLVRPLPSSTWTTLNRQSPRVSPLTQLCGRRTHHVSARAIYENNVELFTPTTYSISFSFPHSFSLFLPPMPTPSISSHFPNTAAFRLYYFDESLTVPTPPYPIPGLHSPYLLTTFATHPSLKAHPHQHIKASRLRMTGNYN